MIISLLKTNDKDKILKADIQKDTLHIERHKGKADGRLLVGNNKGNMVLVY